MSGVAESETALAGRPSEGAGAAQIVEVAFKGNRREFFLWNGEDPPPLKAAVVVEADRGEDFGRVHTVGELAARRCAGAAHGLGKALPTQRVRRLASPDDIRRAAELPALNEDARRRGTERVLAAGLVMKLSDAEWQWDRRKLTFYFTAEKRVDFRALVRELASTFRTRIELKQIGVRDEAKRLDGIGRCGRQYCSASWLPELRPVNLGVAKDQRLSLNPSQISGACGRLMCCLRYEHDFYVQSRKRFPKEGKIITTALGEEKVLANDIFNMRVTLRNAEGETRVIALHDLRDELAGGTPDEGARLPLPVMHEGAAASAGVSSAETPAARTPQPLPDAAGRDPSAPGGSQETGTKSEAPVPGAAEAETRRRRRGRRGGRRSKRPGTDNSDRSTGESPSGE